MADPVAEQDYENQRTKFQAKIAPAFPPSHAIARPDARVQHIDL
jgi:hypothetical protein